VTTHVSFTKAKTDGENFFFCNTSHGIFHLFNRSLKFEFEIYRSSKYRLGCFSTTRSLDSRTNSSNLHPFSVSHVPRKKHIFSTPLPERGDFGRALRENRVEGSPRPRERCLQICAHPPATTVVQYHRWPGSNHVHRPLPLRPGGARRGLRAYACFAGIELPPGVGVSQYF